MSLAKKLCCEHLLDIMPYQSARRIGGSGEVWLNANELAFSYEGYQIDSSEYHRYPELRSPQLFQRYADYAGVKTDQLLCVRGADEGIELMIRTFCNPGVDKILITPPTYGMYQVSADIHGVEVIEAPRRPGFDLDPGAMKSAGEVKLVYICSPNNPTGNLSSHEEFVDLLSYYRDTALVVVDEAYMEFYPQGSPEKLLAQFDNLVLIRTLSKAFGLAAVRCGFVIAHSDVIELLSKVIAPYPLPEPVEQIAIQALSPEGIARMQRNVEQIDENRKLLVEHLENIDGIEEIYKSYGNFVMVRFTDEQQALELLARDGIVVRAPYATGMTKNCQRISIGTENEIKRVITALEGLTEGLTV